MTFSGPPCNGAAHVFWYLIALYGIVPTSMHGNIVGLQVKKIVWLFIIVYMLCVCVQIAKILARLRGCAALSENVDRL